jgi:hypothetical protein
VQSVAQKKCQHKGWKNERKSGRLACRGKNVRGRESKLMPQVAQTSRVIYPKNRNRDRAPIDVT